MIERICKTFRKCGEVCPCVCLISFVVNVGSVGFVLRH